MREDLQNYNSLDSFQFLAGWVRELLVRRYPGDEALVMGGKRELSILDFTNTIGQCIQPRPLDQVIW